MSKFIRCKVIRRRTKAGRRYVVRWRLPSGRWRQETIPRRYSRNAHRRETFRAAVEDRVNRLGDAEPAEPATVASAVAEFLESRRTKRLKPSSILSYRYVLERFRDDVPARNLEDVTPAMIGRFLAGRKVGRATVRKEFVSLRAFFLWGERVGYLSASPHRKVDAPPKVGTTHAVIYTEAEARAILKAATKRRTWVQASIRLAMLSGLRTGEIEALSAEDVDFARRLIRIPAQKSAADRWVAIDADTGGLLHELAYRGERILWGPPDDPFISEQMFRRRLWTQIYATCEAAGVRRPVKPVHDLRRTFGTLAARAGVPLFVLQQAMGHQTIETTRQFYYQPRAAEDADRALAGVTKALQERNG